VLLSKYLKTLNFANTWTFFLTLHNPVIFLHSTAHRRTDCILCATLCATKTPSRERVLSEATSCLYHMRQVRIGNRAGQTLNSMAWQMKITERACHSTRRCVTTTRNHNCTEYGKQGADFTNESAQTWPSLTLLHWWIITLYNLAPFYLLPFDPLRIRSLSITFINFKPGYNLRVRVPTCNAPIACWPPELLLG